MWSDRMRILSDIKEIVMKKQTAGRDALGTFAPKFAEEIAEVITLL